MSKATEAMNRANTTHGMSNHPVYSVWQQMRARCSNPNTKDSNAMKTYINVKSVKAKPMTLGDYNKLREWTTPDNEDPLKEGYLVEYPNSPTTGMPKPFTNYISWSPKREFEEGCRGQGTMTFGHAIALAKKGYKVARKGWNGTGMYAVLMPGYPEGVPATASTAEAHNVPIGTIIKVRPHWVLKTAQDGLASWAPSGSDTLAEDWMVVK